MDIKIIFDSVKGEGEIFLYEEWTRKKGKEKETKKVLNDEDPVAWLDFKIEKDSLHVSSLEVEEKYRRKGLGKLIMQIIFALSTYWNVQTTLISGNDDASKFYKAIGMKEDKKDGGGNFFWTPKPKHKRKKL